MPLDQSRKVLAPFLAAADLILPTAAEACVLTGTTQVDRAVELLGTSEDAVVVLKDGPAGCTIYGPKGRQHVPGFIVQEVDPTGAGDCFSAAFIAGLEAGWSLNAVGRFANAAGALAITQMGPMEGAPTRAQVEQFITEHRADLHE
jgi:sugar/nucleoside kinase (ribokinase family)